MNDTVGFVENHLTGLQGEIGGNAIVSNDLQGPMVIIRITILRNVQNGGYHEGQSIDVGCQETAAGIRAHAVDTGGYQRHATRPVFQDALDGPFDGAELVRR